MGELVLVSRSTCNSQGWRGIRVTDKLTPDGLPDLCGYEDRLRPGIIWVTLSGSRNMTVINLDVEINSLLQFNHVK